METVANSTTIFVIFIRLDLGYLAKGMSDQTAVHLTHDPDSQLAGSLDGKNIHLLAHMHTIFSGRSNFQSLHQVGMKFLGRDTSLIGLDGVQSVSRLQERSSCESCRSVTSGTHCN